MTPEVQAVLSPFQETPHPRDKAIEAAVPELIKFLPEWVKNNDLSVSEFFYVWSQVHERLFPLPIPPRDDEVKKMVTDLSRYMAAWCEKYQLTAVEAAYVWGIIHHRQSRKECLEERNK
jgi:hypothetical protein